MKFKNMKIEITQNQTVIAVVKELEKQGYVKHQWSESINTGVVLVFDNGLFTNNSYHYPIRNFPLFSLSDLEAERHG